MNKEHLNQAQCQPCQSGMGTMTPETVLSYLTAIDAAWHHQVEPACIIRSFKFKNFSQTMSFVNAVANLADQQGHHPDVEFGYNYCRVKFTTHAAKGLTLNDFICAKKVDQIFT